MIVQDSVDSEDLMRNVEVNQNITGVNTKKIVQDSSDSEDPMRNVEVNKKITGVETKKMLFADQASATDTQSEIPEVNDPQKLMAHHSN